MRLATEVLRDLYTRIPKKWKIWILSFLIAWLIRWICGVETLIIILIFAIALSVLFRNLGGTKTLIIGKQAVRQLFGYFRGVIIFAFLPVVWELVRNLIRVPSLEPIFELVVIIIVILVIWKRFDEIIEKYIRKNFGTRRRRR